MTKLLCYAALGLVGLSAAQARPKWEGTIAKVAGDGRVYITAGSQSGLRAGAQLVVRRPGEPITDPKTHQILGHELGRTVASLELESHLGDKLSVCTVLRGGRGLKIGDPVTVDKSADSGEEEEEAVEEAPPPRPVAKPIAKPVAKPVAEVTPKVPPGKPQPLHTSDTTAKNGKCIEGKYLNAATAGHCCWPEQLWSDQAKACIGAPRCPNGFQRQGLECIPRAPSRRAPSDDAE